MPWEVLMVPCQLLTAITARLSDLGPGDGQVFQPIWFLTATNRPTRRVKPHSVGGRWNENSLLNLSQDVPIHVQLKPVITRHNKRRVPPIMTTFACLFNAPGSSRSPRSQRPPRTTVARGASHLTNGVTEPRKITGYSLSNYDNSNFCHIITI